MTGPMYVVVAILLVGLLYLVMRRRGSREAERPGDTGFRSVSEQAKARSGEAAREPATIEPRGIPPVPARSGGDSGSSHPAYPVAPAKYAGAPSTGGSSGRYDTPRPAEATATAATGSVTGYGAEMPIEVKPPADAAPAQAPWYPEAPASYTEREAEGTGRGETSEPDGRA